MKQQEQPDTEEGALEIGRPERQVDERERRAVAVTAAAPAGKVQELRSQENCTGQPGPAETGPLALEIGPDHVDAQRRRAEVGADKKDRRHDEDDGQIVQEIDGQPFDGVHRSGNVGMQQRKGPEISQRGEENAGEYQAGAEIIQIMYAFTHR